MDDIPTWDSDVNVDAMIEELERIEKESGSLHVQVQNVCNKFNIKHYWCMNDNIKAACVERFNRTVKTRLFRYLTARHTKRWIDVLDALIESYNKSFQLA